MKKYIRIAAMMLLCIAMITVAALSASAEEKQTLSLGGGSGVEYVHGVTTWREAVKDSSSGAMHITESGLVCAAGCVVVDDNGDPVKPSDVIMSNIDYVRLEGSLLSCSIYSTADSSLVYSFQYFKGWTFYDYVNFAAENGDGTTKIDVTQGIAYYRTSCVNYPIMMSSNTISGDTAIGSSFVIDLTSEDTISFHVGKETVTKQATCTSEGEWILVCEDCGTTLGSGNVPALGHDWQDATCTVPKTCKTCGETEGKALGHVYSWCVCENCGHFDLLCRSGLSSDNDNDNNDQSGSSSIFGGLFGGSSGNNDQSGSSSSSGGLFDGIGDSISDGVDSVKNWFSDLEKTIDTLFGILLGVLGVVLFCILGTYVVRFIRELLPDRNSQYRGKRK